ncbi:unnamed protein product [Boreogadus saida]
MTCVEKRHLGQRAGSMLHHRFPNGFTELLMDEADREVSTLTDRAFRSLCVGDDAVYNDEFTYGFSPFNCHKPLVGTPRKTKTKESKKQAQSQHHGSNGGKDLQQSMTQVSSFLKALSATEKGCKGILDNSAEQDSNGESWDKSALRSIRMELSDFSSDYHVTLADGHFGQNDRHRNPSGDGSSKKSGKDSSKVRNGKSTIQLRKLNIKNFFLHSEFSPFQMWRDLNRFPFGREEIVTSIPSDKIPKWYDSPLYRELAEAHRIDIFHAEESQTCLKALAKEPSMSAEGVEPCQRVGAGPPPTPATKPHPPPPPPKVPPKPKVLLAEMRCSSNTSEANAAPWRQNKSRSRSALPVNLPNVIPPPQGRISKTIVESLRAESVVQVKQEAISVKVQAIEECCSAASTPFSICQLMTPLIPSRQPTETSEILQLALDLPLRPDSEARLGSENPIRREGYKSLASSILFNLKDNRKRVKSRYSPPKFRSSEMPDRDTQPPRVDNGGHTNMGSEGLASGLNTPAIFKEGWVSCSPVSKQANTPCVDAGKHDFCSPLSDDYLITNLLQTKREASGSRNLGEENYLAPVMQMKNHRSPMVIKKNYPSLNLYKKAFTADNGAGPPQAPQKALSVSPDNRRHLLKQTEELLPDAPKGEAVNAVLSPNIVQRLSPKIAADVKVPSPYKQEKESLAYKQHLPENTSSSETQSKDFAQFIAVNDKDASSHPLSTMDVINAARDAINAEKNKASHSSHIKNMISEPKRKLTKRNTDNSKEDIIEDRSVMDHHFHQNKTGGLDDIVSENTTVKRNPPPVPKRNFTKSDIIPTLEKLSDLPSPTDEYLIERDPCNAKNDYIPKYVSDSVRKDARKKHVFSARQNNYIKTQRHAEREDEQEEVHNEGKNKVRIGLGKKEEMMRDSGHIINDLNALKELERARRGDVLDKARERRGSINIDEETKAKNDLISRELRNIKKGMLSMRGNTQAKRDMFTKKEQERNKQEGFPKLDNHVVLNKAIINDNYDRAKMALEEVISERQKYKSLKEKDADPLLAENTATEHDYAQSQEQRETVLQNFTADAKENQNGRMLALRDMELKERLGDLRDHNQIKHILSQTETRPGAGHQLCGMVPLPGINAVSGDLKKRLASNSNDLNNGIEQLNDARHIPDLELKNNLVRLKTSEENGKQLLKENKENLKTKDVPPVPPVPPRSKKGVTRKDEEDNIKESGSAMDGTEEDFSIKDGPKDKRPSITDVNTDSEREEQNRDTFNHKLGKKNEKTNSTVEGHPILPECVTSSELQTKNGSVSPREERRKEITYSQESLCSLGSPRKVKRKAPLRPDDVCPVEPLNQESIDLTEKTGTTNLITAEADQTTKAEVIPDQVAAIDIPRNIVSPLVLVNGYNINQSPPDQASLSSKSSYFSVESAGHRNNDVYHSLENLTAGLEENDGEPINVLGNLNNDSASTGTELVSVWERETEVCKPLLKTPGTEKEEADREVGRHRAGEGGEGGIDSLISQQTKEKTINSTPMSPASTLSSPSFDIPALFIVKDNTFSNKPVKPVHLWLPKEHLNGSEFSAINHVKKNLPPGSNTAIASSNHSQNIITSFAPGEVSPQNSPLNSLSPLSVSNDINFRRSQFGPTLTVPQEEDRNSGVSPLSDGVESWAADSRDDLTAEMEDGEKVSKMPSERSGSPSSASGSQSGPSKPPPVLPKSEKALMKAMKLTTRRIKKEEGQKKPSQKSSSSSRKPRAVKHNADNPGNVQTEDKPSTTSRRHTEKRSQSINKEHAQNNEERYRPNESSRHHRHTKTKTEEAQYPQRAQGSDRLDHSQVVPSGYKAGTQDRKESCGRSVDRLPDVILTEREGRSSDQHHHPRNKPERRNYSSDRVISNVPVYKAQVSESRPAVDRQSKRSQSVDRHVRDHAERRASADMSVNTSEMTETRNHRIEKSIMEELQQRGRAREKAGRGGDVTVKRSHSIDAYATEAPRPANLSRQSSYSGQQLSRQSSVEHTIVTQSIPMTQRKLLQDPDSGQYFFVDMPIQVKTKTFYDPETGNYLQLPVQPPEGAIPQASTMEVLNTPMMLYHGFVPVPMTSISHKSVVQASQMEQDEFERRQNERSRQVYSNEGRPYLEPVYGQHDHMLGDFLGVEELDCAS